MAIPFTFPYWVPWWLQLLVVVVAILLGLAFLLMPFSVFGLKSRLDAIEVRLDEIQGEIRSLALRLPEPTRGIGYEDETPVLRVPEPDREQRSRPPIPPASWAGRPAPQPRGRAEPRL